MDADQSNAIYRRGQSIVETQSAAALRGVGQMEASVAHNERALQLAQALSKDAPGSAQYRSDVGSNERKLFRSTRCCRKGGRWTATCRAGGTNSLPE